MAKHIHKYLLKDIGINKKYPVYMCSLPDCTHYLSARQAVGKQSVCWRCGDTCLIVKTDEKYAVRPHCLGCTRIYPQHKGKGKGETISTEELERLFQGLDLRDDLIIGDEGEE